MLLPLWAQVAVVVVPVALRAQAALLLVVAKALVPAALLVRTSAAHRR